MNEVQSSPSDNHLDHLSTSNKKHKRPNRAYHDFQNSVGDKNSTTILPSLPIQGLNGCPDDGNVSNIIQNFSSVTISPTEGPYSSYSKSHFIATQRLINQQQMLAKTLQTATFSLPPLCTSQFYCDDQGLCDPRLMSLTMYNIPNDEYLRSATKLPMGCIIQPFITTIPNSAILPIDTTSLEGPLRCRRCRAYVNPKFQFTYDCKVICNFCKIKTQLDPSYCALFTSNGQTPNISKGCVDFLVPKIYNVHQDKPNVPLHYVFLIDISTMANENKSSLIAIDGVRTCINYIRENQSNCKIGIIAYDKWLRFFNLDTESTQAQELILTDINDLFLPLFHGLFVRPEDSIHVIQDTLCKLESFIQDDKYLHNNEACYGTALEAARLALDVSTGGQGGKIIATLNTFPTIGNGSSSLQVKNGLQKNLKCGDDFYLNFSKLLLKSHVSLDLFCTASASIDLATLAHPVFVTSGTLKYYNDFQIDKDEFAFLNDLLYSVSSTVGYQAQLKVRASSGLSVYNYYSQSIDNTDRDPIIPVLTKDQIFPTLLKLEEKLKVGTNVYFQAAILYTDLNGIRKVRCINTSGTVSDNVGEIFKFVNQDAVTNIIIQDILRSLGDCNFVEIRKTIDDKLSDILTQYRCLVGTSNYSQLVLPDSLKSLPSYLLSFEKSDLMKHTKQLLRSNERIFDLFKFSSYNLPRLSFKLYPQIIPLHQQMGQNDLNFYDENNLLLQFESIENLICRNCHSQLINGGCYLIFWGDAIYLWFNENTNNHLLHDLLGADVNTSSFKSISILGGKLPEINTEISIKARSLIKNWCQLIDCTYVPVILLRPNVDQYYSHIMGKILCEDKSIEMIESYDNYLIFLHRKIKENIKHGNYIKLLHSKDHDAFRQKFIQF